MTFDTHFADAVRQGVAPRHRDQYRELWERNSHLHGKPEGEQKLITVGVAYSKRNWKTRTGRRAAAARTATTAPTVMIFAEPDGLDDEGQALHAEVQAFAREHDLDDYMAALAGVTGRRDLDPGAIMGTEELAEHFSGDDVDVDASAELERRARQLAHQEDVHVFDAAGIVDLDDRIDEVEADDGYAPTEWLDTSSDLHPKPWRDDDYERDQRRAATFGRDLSRDEWQAAAEQGIDLVFAEASKLRADRLDELEGKRATQLEAAKDREAERRQQAINDELHRRAARRLGAS